MTWVTGIAIVAAITSKISPVPYPVEVLLIQPSTTSGLAAPSSIHLGQIIP
jgi:hypothetical protein